jgi:hypothetical protein
VRNHEDGSAPFIEGSRKGTECFPVKVVGRFVENKEMGALRGDVEEGCIRILIRSIQ